ncbi:MarR family winged helix-turn-helix transcriptional regulator [Plantactinospora sp. GCM10030261]|uniref:MarR family winged helix-turn-helix transcriptional regulator n=1 Tax=Plantactinospora sp. GCM10030261 TaxID=3273420 RepID=UPI003607CF4E
MESPDAAPPARMRGLPSWLMSQSAAYGYRLLTEAMATVDARPYHYRLLATLAEVGPLSQAQLGRRSAIHLSDVVAAINELADRKFVVRSPDPADRRRNIITITPAGHRQLDELEKQVSRIQDELLAPLDPAERGQLVALLARIREHHAVRTRSRSDEDLSSRLPHDAPGGTKPHPLS